MRGRPIVLLGVLASACGGRLAPIDGGTVAPDGAGPDGQPDAGGDATASDASEAGDLSDAPVECSYDASEDDPCTPPVDDAIYADPAEMSVAAGSYGATTFVASGPWISDPGMYMWFAGSSLPLENVSQVMSYGSPQSLIFQVPKSEAGQTLTFSVAGHAGNITRVGELTVHVTSCAPWPASVACPGYECDFEPDNCGGLVSCGTCPPQAPYCLLHQCVAAQPTYCPSGQTLGMGGVCVPCSGTFTCTMCPAGIMCVGVQDVCLCLTGG